MPRELKDIKKFLLTARRKDAKSVKIKKNKSNVKFKVCSIYILFVECFVIDEIECVDIKYSTKFIFIVGSLQQILVHVGHRRCVKG
jgi:hypothetical protein